MRMPGQLQSYTEFGVVPGIARLVVEQDDGGVFGAPSSTAARSRTSGPRRRDARSVMPAIASLSPSRSRTMWPFSSERSPSATSTFRSRTRTHDCRR